MDSKTKVPRVDTGAVYTAILAMVRDQFADRPPLLDVPVTGCVWSPSRRVPAGVLEVDPEDFIVDIPDGMG